MAWSLKWGKHVKAFELQARKTGFKAPALKNRPQLLTQDADYYAAFHTLSRARCYSENGRPEAVPVSEVLALCQLVGIAYRAERLKYLNLVQDLDQVWLEHWASTQSSK